LSKFIAHFELPVPSTESIHDARVAQYGKVAILRFDYYQDSKARRSGIRFDEVIALKTRGERACTSWHIRSYDKLTEVVDSEWAKQMREELPYQYRSQFEHRHFMIYLDSAGCFEVLAKGFQVIPEEDGEWDS
jgi:hypothetical protein